MNAPVIETTTDKLNEAEESGRLILTDNKGNVVYADVVYVD